MMRRYIHSIITGKQKGAVALLIRAALYPLSLVYGVSVFVVMLLYKLRILKTERVDCKVISVGNITWGGTGKTPVVEFLARRFSSAGKKVAVLMRGYGEDESILLKTKLPEVSIFVGRDRVKAAQQALAKYKPEVLLLDDGFQHWRLKRDIDIVTVDSTNPFGNRHLLPLGILREPLRNMARADVILLTRVDSDVASVEAAKSALLKLNAQAPIFETGLRPAYLTIFPGSERIELSDVSNRAVCAFCGIGNPEDFFNCLEKLGAKIASKFTFLDHHNYTEDDLQRIEEACLNTGINTIVTTEKDAVRLERLPGFRRQALEPRLRILVLHIELKIKEEDEFLARLRSVLNS